MAVVKVEQGGSWTPVGEEWIPEHQRAIIPKEPGTYQLRPASQVWRPYASSADGGCYEAIYAWISGVTPREEWPDIRELPGGTLEAWREQQARLGALKSGGP